MREKIAVFAVGAVGYSGIEILARGYTHWSMTLLGGTCFIGLWRIARTYARQPLWCKALLGSALITTLEFFVGVLVNLRLGWSVWDYSGEAFDILGQICPLYSFYWFLLSGAACWLIEQYLRLRREL